MTLHVRAKVLLHVWPYDFYDETLSTERRHIINRNMSLLSVSEKALANVSLGCSSFGAFSCDIRYSRNAQAGLAELLFEGGAN